MGFRDSRIISEEYIRIYQGHSDHNMLRLYTCSFMYVCMYVCMNVYMYVCMHRCMNVYVYIYIYIYIYVMVETPIR